MKTTQASRTIQVLVCVALPARLAFACTVTLTYGGLTGAEKQNPGGYLLVNDDDDNGNGIPDYEETGADADIKVLGLSKDGPDQGTITLDVPSNMQAYADASRTTVSKRSWDLSKGEQLPAAVYLEGFSPTTNDRQVAVTLTWTGSGAPGGNPSDTVNFTVMQLSLAMAPQVMYNNNDNNTNGNPDRLDDKPVANEEDHVVLGVVAKGSSLGTVSLSSSEGSKVKLWQVIGGQYSAVPASWTPAQVPSGDDRIEGEGVGPSAAVDDVTVTLAWAHPHSAVTRTAKTTVASVDLVVDGLSQCQEDAPGAVVVRRIATPANNAPRKKVTLNGLTGAGNLRITRSNTKVKIFTTEAGSTEIDYATNSFAPGTPLWVQGEAGSGTMRDVTLTLAPVSGGLTDTARLTVLWVEIAGTHTGQLSTDNAARDVYASYGVPPTYNLGPIFCATDSPLEANKAAYCRGSEFIGTVQPSDFLASLFGATPLFLDRISLNGKYHWGPTGKENSADYPSGPDTSSPYLRDDQPAPNGRIYDCDAPGVLIWDQPANTIMRVRRNFRAFADYGSVRCSLLYDWYTRASYKLTGPSDKGTATGWGANTITDSTKEWAPDRWVPGGVYIYEGTGIGQVRKITVSTKDTITVSRDWGPGLGDNSKYLVIHRDTWTALGDVQEDNVNAEGTTPLTWDLK